MNSSAVAGTGMVEFKSDGVVVWTENSTPYKAWVRDGATDWFLTEEDKKLSGPELVTLIKVKWNGGKGVFRCSSCGKEMKESEVASWPLFAGCACSSCSKAHGAHLQEQRDKGQVCRACHQPYDSCCC